ncbi:MAG: NADH-quinone oxidoreductase subunit N [Saprospiraceae bacterium]|jgi:NADH-quinone oxidoreductase subunit N
MMPENFNLLLGLPEMFISAMACFILIYRLYDTSHCPNLMPFVMSVATLVLSALMMIGGYSTEVQMAYNDAYVRDPMSIVVKTTIVLITACVFIYGARYNKERGYFKTEFYVLGLFGVVGMMLMTSASNLLTLYIGLELFSLSLYAMVAFYRDSRVASEAAIKYFILGALASAILLYSISLLYGLSGSLQLSEINVAIAALGTDNLGVILAVVLAVVGLAFKLGAVPFHMWVPDVYQGSPTSVTAYLGAAPKIAAFAMIMRLLVEGLDSQLVNWQGMLIILAILSVAVGNIVAIVQTNIKRMLAYSTISHMGFFLFGILSGTQLGYGAALFYVLIYAVMSLGVFGLILLRCTPSSESERMVDFKGLATRSPGLAVLMGILMFSMAGIPPFAGFWAKLSVINALVDADLIWVAVVAVLLAVIGAYYYLRVIKVMFFDDADLELAPVAENHFAIRWLLVFNILALLLIIPWIGSLIDLTRSVIL